MIRDHKKSLTICVYAIILLLMDLRDKKTIDSYNKIAKQYDKENEVSVSGSYFWQQELKAFTSKVPGKKIIEIGSAGGRDARLFIKEGFDYLGIDATSSFIKISKKKNPKGKFKQMSFYNLKFPSGTFDGFWSTATFLHIPKNRFPKVLRSVHKILKLCGVGVISVKEGKGEKVIKQNRYGGVERFFAFYSAQEFKKVLKENGFKTIKVFPKKREGDNIWLSFLVQKV